MIANAWIERVNTAPSRTGLVPSPPAVRSATQSIASGERDRVRGSQSQAVIPHPIPLPWRSCAANRRRGQGRGDQTGCVENAASSGVDPMLQTLARRQWHARRLRMWLGLFVVLLSAASAHAAGFTQPDAAALPNVYQWTDTVNVWVVRDGDSAVLIDLGDGSVLEHLDEIGVKRIEWVLFTNHHREHCQGASKLARAGNLSMLKIKPASSAASDGPRPSSPTLQAAEPRLPSPAPPSGRRRSRGLRSGGG